MGVVAAGAVLVVAVVMRVMGVSVRGMGVMMPRLVRIMAMRVPGTCMGMGVGHRMPMVMIVRMFVDVGVPVAVTVLSARKKHATNLPIQQPCPQQGDQAPARGFDPGLGHAPLHAGHVEQQAQSGHKHERRDRLEQGCQKRELDASPDRALIGQHIRCDDGLAMPRSGRMKDAVGEAQTHQEQRRVHGIFGANRPDRTGKATMKIALRL